MKTLFISLFLLFIHIDNDQNDIAGTWTMNENNAEIEINKNGNVYNGTVIKSDNPKAIGKVVLRDFKKDGNEWKGKFYAVKRDRTVNATIKETGAGAMEMVIHAGPRTRTIPMSRLN